MYILANLAREVKGGKLACMLISTTQSGFSETLPLGAKVRDATK